ncbi:hypothetical protein BR93DRAFT_929495 [Coniochaeta sp. PMI_546]|nr:hypothetical protein BR93DRAFT_929495 [Coniochaeta sp. PMI_546]
MLPNLPYYVLVQRVEKSNPPPPPRTTFPSRVCSPSGIFHDPQPNHSHSHPTLMPPTQLPPRSLSLSFGSAQFYMVSSKTARKSQREAGRAGGKKKKTSPERVEG